MKDKSSVHFCSLIQDNNYDCLGVWVYVKKPGEKTKCRQGKLADTHREPNPQDIIKTWRFEDDKDRQINKWMDEQAYVQTDKQRKRKKGKVGGREEERKRRKIKREKEKKRKKKNLNLYYDLARRQTNVEYNYLALGNSN